MSLLLDRVMGAPLLFARRRRPRTAPDNPRILVIRRNRMGDMLCTLPLFRVLRVHFPTARISVACDKAGAPIARACPAVDRVIVLNSTWTRRLPPVFNAVRLQNHDWVLVAKGGFDRRLARLAPLAHAAVTIGFDPAAPGRSDFYTHPVMLPANAHLEHQIETQLRLLGPLDVPAPRFDPEMLRLRLPGSALQFARVALAQKPFEGCSGLGLINLSSNRTIRFRTEDFASVIQHLLETTDLAIGLVGVPRDRFAIDSLARLFPAERVGAIATPDPLDLAALLERAAIFLTPEGGAAHLSSATQTPTVVMFDAPYGKWCPRGPRHVILEGDLATGAFSAGRVCAAIDSQLARAKG
jgi:ADP-heptose:LPS heptosyltransferase